MNSNVRAAKIILRWGLAFVFFYAAIASFRNPQDWIGYFPQFLRDAFSDKLLLSGFSVYEIILAAWLFLGKRLIWASGLAILTLTGILVFNFGVFEIVFRDVGLLFAALAILELARTGSHKAEE